MQLPDHLRQKLQDREAQGIRRQLKQPISGLDFCSNDYLGLARSPGLHAAFRQALQQHDSGLLGATGSRLLSGNFPAMEALEHKLARFHRAGAALLFNSGYAANTGFFSSLPQRGDTIFYDEASHASIKDGIRLSFAKAYAFRHNSLEDLQARFRLATGQVYVAVESLYSMDGDFAPLADLAALCREQGALLVVDEAHTNGLFGPGGEGLVAALGLEDQVFARILTFGKALGAHGAAVAGSRELADFLVNFSRPFIYTTALPLHNILHLDCAYTLLPELNAERARVQQLAAVFRQLFPNLDSGGQATAGSPIRAVRIPDIGQLKQVAGQLQAAGFDVRPVFPPTVPPGKGQLRVIVHAFNTEEELAALGRLIENSL
ncbi:MAG: aminotransferase class I/II-fold pyridoxal phosphate-dependent enzyme [Adhaeribacter sp.]